MLRIDAMRAVYPRLETCIVVTIMGAVSAELQSLGHQPNFFYLQHAMGLASSMGLGIALSRPELKVVVFDGDGSVVMNLGRLTTLARYRPHNLVHVVFDNESLLSVGGFPTATSTGSDIAGTAAAAGIPRTPVIGLPPQFASSPGVTIDQISRYDEKGPGWYWNTIRMGEHTGTHFDAPIHWITGKDLPRNACDTIPVSRFVGPACVIDVTHEVDTDEDFVLMPSHIEAWEK